MSIYENCLVLRDIHYQHVYLSTLHWYETYSWLGYRGILHGRKGCMWQCKCGGGNHWSEEKAGRLSQDPPPKHGHATQCCFHATLLILPLHQTFISSFPTYIKRYIHYNISETFRGSGMPAGEETMARQEVPPRWYQAPGEDQLVRPLRKFLLSRKTAIPG